MTLAEDMRPETTHLIGVTLYALQRQTRMWIQADVSSSTLA